jgi:hypothetical protein
VILTDRLVCHPHRRCIVHRRRGESIFSALVITSRQLLLRAIRHGNGPRAFDEHERRAADYGHTSRPFQSLLKHAYFRALALDRQFSNASPTLSLD